MSKITEQRRKILKWSLVFLFFLSHFEVASLLLLCNVKATCSSETFFPCHPVSCFAGGGFVSVWWTTREEAIPGMGQAAKVFGMNGLKLTYFEWSQFWEKQAQTRILWLQSAGISGHFPQHVTSFSFQTSVLKIAWQTLWTIVFFKHNMDCTCAYDLEEVLCEMRHVDNLFQWHRGSIDWLNLYWTHTHAHTHTHTCTAHRPLLRGTDMRN